MIKIMSDAMKSVRIAAMEELIGTEIKVLDKGFVRLIDYMGDDAAIVQAARVSYGAGTKTVNEDAGLINYLMRHRHTSPFEMCEIKLHVKMPIFIARQWLRHRTANVNELSGRYSVINNESYLPEIEELCVQSKGNKQGRDVQIAEERAKQIQQYMQDHANETFEQYDNMINNDNLARELSRITLPQSTYTEMYWKIDLHNLLHFISLRNKPNAQKEIRDFADVIAEQIVKIWVPHSYNAFMNYKMNAVTFSGVEMAELSQLLDKEKISAFIEANSKAKGELREMCEKLQAMLNKQ
jgi:thymidylate synthase (FAD)